LSIHEAEPDVIVRDIMSRPPVTAGETDDASKVSKLMLQHDIGCVIVLDKSGKPSGIITERDIVQRVAAKNILSSDVRATEVMSKPIVTISPGASVNDAAKLMNQRRIRRLAVIESGKLVGVLTQKDILNVTPTLIDLIYEKSKVGKLESPRSRTSNVEGYCDECETWSENLVQRDGVFVCPDCARDLAAAEETSQ
jgi:CBS domain-containing protein